MLGQALGVQEYFTLLGRALRFSVSRPFYPRDLLIQMDFAFGWFPNILLMSIVKPIFFGLIIALTGCYYGLQASGGGEGVGRATTRAMVLAFVLILVSDFFLTQLLLLFFNIIRYGALRKFGDFGGVGGGT